MSQLETDDIQGIPDDQAGGDNQVAPPISTDYGQEPGPQPVASNGAAVPAQGDASPTSGLLQDAESLPATQAIRGGAKNIVSYLMGEGAAPQDAISDDADENLRLIEQAAKQGGPAAAWAFLQANRQAYNAKQAFAYTALNGIDGKAGDIAAAADAANKAGAHILDGSKVEFKPHENGVTATVSTGRGPGAQINLTPAQFNQYLDVGGDGQYDKVLENGGAPTVLQQIARGPGKPLQATANQQSSPQQSPQTARPGGRANNPAVRAGHAIARDVTEGNQPALPGTHDADGHYIGPTAPNQTNYGQELESRSQAIYGGQPVTAEPERQQWMQQQENVEEERENKLKMADAGNQAKERIAGIRANATMHGADTRASAQRDVQNIRSKSNMDIEQSRHLDRQAKLNQAAKLQADRLVAAAQTAADRNKLMRYRAELTNPNRLLMTEKDLSDLQAKYGFNVPLGNTLGQAPQAPMSVPPVAPAPAATSSQPSGGQSAVPPAAQRQAGQVYTTPKGRFLWTGKGWQPAQ